MSSEPEPGRTGANAGEDTVRLEEFCRLSSAEVADLVRAAGTKVCVFPINGTRRWFMLEHVDRLQGQDPATSYLDVVANRHVELYELLFDHGLDTLLTPVFGPDLLERGGEYMEMAAEGLARLATHPGFLQFYRGHDVRVRFYGDYRRFFEATPYERLTGLFDEVTVATQGHTKHRLFFGVCAQDATESVAALAVRDYLQYGSIPDKKKLIELYYGEAVDAVDLFVGFDKFAVFDMPLLATGAEDLYFTVSPSLYLGARQLREILYDHLYARRGGETDYTRMSVEDWARMREFYRVNSERTLGVGVRDPATGTWYPLQQVTLPENFESFLDYDQLVKGQT